MTWIAVTTGGPPGPFARCGVNDLVRVRGLRIDGFIAVWLEYQFGSRLT